MKIIVLIIFFLTPLQLDLSKRNQEKNLYDEVIKLTASEYGILLMSSQKMNLEASSIIKKEGVVRIEAKNKTIKLVDHLDANCQACVRIYEVLGELKSIGKIIIEEQHFRNSLNLLIDVNTGKIDTLESELFFSPDLETLINSNSISKDMVIGGFKVFDIKKRELLFKKEFLLNWRINELSWTEEGEMLVKGNPIEDEIIHWDDFEYYRIKI